MKFGTTGTARAVAPVLRIATTLIAVYNFVFPKLMFSQIQRTVISDTNCPVAVVPAPPAVTVVRPALVIVPARLPAVPAVVEVRLEKLGTSPTVGAEVGTASACV